jgi:hypothetical protein
MTATARLAAMSLDSSDPGALAVDDLDDAEARALALGAAKAKMQPSPDRWRVLLDPAGHPFCRRTLIPDA